MARVCALAHITKTEQGAHSETQMYSPLTWHMLPTLEAATERIKLLVFLALFAPHLSPG